MINYYNKIDNVKKAEKNPMQWKMSAIKVIKVDNEHFELLCAVCGKTAVKFIIDFPIVGDSKDLIYSGITHSKAIGLKHKNKIFQLLTDKKISELHNYLIKYCSFEDGIDAYCPQCDKIYCREHYNVKIVWDNGFYDYAIGKCPEGHERIIDD